jgi:hypothetical protein
MEIAIQADQSEPNEERLDRYRGLPLRAPMLVALVLKPQAHPNVPEIEQVLSLGAACHGMLTAAHALGIGYRDETPRTQHGVIRRSKRRFEQYIQLIMGWCRLCQS